MAGVLSERQETGLVDAINVYSSKIGKPFSLYAGSIVLHEVISAKKVAGRLPNGDEPYTDVEIQSKRGIYKLSLKGPSAPSMAGGGLNGLEKIVPGFSGKFLNAALNEYTKRGYKDGDQVPDMYGKVSDSLKELIVVGNASMGGPITHLYIGPMDVTSNGSGLTLHVNGRLFDAKKYAKSHDLYLRLRKRRADQPFDSKSKDKFRYPLILGKSPSAGDTGRRIVIVAKPPLNAITVGF